MKNHFFLLFLLIPIHLFGQNTGIIPTPQLVEWSSQPFSTHSISYQFISNDPEINQSKPIQHICSETIPLLDKSGLQKVQNNSHLKNSLIIQLSLQKTPVTNEEGYILEINPDNILIKSSSIRGIYYGIISLKQNFDYLNGTNQKIQCCKITDWPIIKNRGWMDDISRGPIPTVEFIKEEIKTLSYYKMNCFNLYVENIFSSSQYPDLAPVDGLTPEEIKEIEEYASLHFVAFMPNQQVFGHMEKMLANPAYSELGDDSYILDPGNPDTKQFLFNYLNEIVPLYQSPYFNINCDETESLGSGRAKKYVDSLGKSEAYVQHILNIYSILKPWNKKIMMWGDIMLKDGAIIDQLPKDIIPIFWAYHAGSSFASSMEKLEKTGFQYWIAPGTSSWHTILPDNNTYIPNIAVMVRDGAHHKASGMLNTSWDDTGESLFQSLWHAHIWSAENSWNPCKETENEKFQMEMKNRLTVFNENYSISRFGIPGYGDLIDEINDIISQDQIITPFSSTWTPLLHFQPSLLSQEFLKSNTELIQSILPIQFKLKSFQSLALKNGSDIDYLYYATERFFINTQKNICRNILFSYSKAPEINQKNIIEADLFRLKKSIQNLKIQYLSLWKNECRSHYLIQNLKKYDQFYTEIEEIPYRFTIEATNSFPQLNNPKSINKTSSEQVIVLKPILDTPLIYYTLDGSQPTRNSNMYDQIIKIDRDCILKTVVFDPLNKPYFCETFVKQHFGVGTIQKLGSKYSDYKPEYSGGGEHALGDGFKGSTNFADGKWQGFQGNDIELEYNFHTTKLINLIEADFYQNCLGWILAPSCIELYTSEDGIHFTFYKSLKMNAIDPHENGIFKNSWNHLNMNTQYLRIVVKNGGKLPSWHTSPGADSYIFCDEIIIR